MCRTQLVLTALLASMLVGFGQMRFFAIQGVTTNPMDDDTVNLSPVGPGTNAQLRINLMFINIPGQTSQPIRSALFVFVPQNPIAVPGGQLLRAEADPAQASNQLVMDAYIDPMTGVRVGEAIFPARFQIRDTNGNVQEQTGTVQITVRDREPFAFQRPNPSSPRDRIEIQFVINNTPVPYTGELANPRGEANLFVGGRII